MSVEFAPLQYYIDRHSSNEDDLLYRLNRETHLKIVNPRMLSGQVQGKFLEFISRMYQPANVLEIGTFTGYSAICLAKGMKEGGRLTTIEINDEIADFAQKYFKQAGIEGIIDQRIGNALDIIPELEGKFDLVFIDGDKKEYPAYYQQVIKKIKPGGYLIADNVLWGNKVIEETAEDDPETAAIKEFNKIISEDPGVENVILSVRDGLNLIRKK